jgi:hypothetical protein
MCCVRGCFLPGSIADSTTGSSDWFCHLHHGMAYGELAGITARMHNRRNLLVLAARLKNTRPGQTLPDNVIPWLQRHNRGDIASAYAALPRQSARALGALMQRILGDECAMPQQRLAGPDSKAKAVSDSWHKAVDLVGDLG